MNWYLAAWRKFAVFTGRSRRKEYWFFALFNFIALVLLVSVDYATGTLDENAIRSHVAAHLAGFKVPTHVFIHHEPLPRNATQKVLKKSLKQHYANKLSGN